MRVLITGAAGFIGYHLCKRLLSENLEVLGIDNFDPYYDVSLKKDRIRDLEKFCAKHNFTSFTFSETDITDEVGLANLFESFEPNYVVNLAAQAGVRYSIENPQAYVRSNIEGFTNVIGLAVRHRVEHFLYASTSSVYGDSEEPSLAESHAVDHPIQFYAATKRANELIAHSFSHLNALPTTGMRFFTVYGPWGRPDMALFKFTKAILDDKPIELFNRGNHIRDFTFVDDTVEGIARLLLVPPRAGVIPERKSPDLARSPFRIVNIGHGNPVHLRDYVAALERALGKKARVSELPMQPGDIYSTSADIDKLKDLVDFSPRVGVNEGVTQFVEWYKDYYPKISS